MSIRELIQELAKGEMQELYSTVCTVTAVDSTERTCDVMPVNGDAKILGVRLQAGLNGTVGFVMLPAVDSQVVVTWLNKTTGYVALMSEVEEVELHGGQFGGILKVNESVQRWNNIEYDINQLKQIFASWVTVPQDGGAALKTLAATWASTQLQATNNSDVENDKVKHG